LICEHFVSQLSAPVVRERLKSSGIMGKTPGFHAAYGHPYEAQVMIEIFVNRLY
jgi:hypothetical protein